MVAQICNPNFPAAEARRSQIPKAQNEFQASLGYVRPHHKSEGKKHFAHGFKDFIT